MPRTSSDVAVGRREIASTLTAPTTQTFDISACAVSLAALGVGSAANRHRKMTKITGMQVYDWRFPTSIQSDGSDAVHKDPDVRHCKR